MVAKIKSMKMKYSLNRPYINNLKGTISETLIKQYIGEEVIPRLLDEWDRVFFTNFPIPYLMSKGLFPKISLRNKMELLGEILKNAPDGYIIKLRNTPNKINLKEALIKIGLSRSFRGSWRCGDEIVSVSSEHDENEELSIVNGEIEIVEIKCDKGSLKTHQKQQYYQAIQKGIPLRFFHVNIVSFINNEFEITEKQILHTDDF